MPPPADSQSPPDYRVYRTRKSLLGRRDGDDSLRALRDRSPRRASGAGRRITGRRVAKWLILALVGWIALSLVVFLISAQIQQGKLDSGVNSALGGAGYPLTSANNVLVLGSDQRTDETAEPGSSTEGPSRSDSILLMRLGGGANSRLSIARDTVVDIPGAGRQKINAAFAIGGAALAVQTVESYTGVDVHHVVLVDFENFPGLIDAMGGVTYRGGCVISRINGGFRNGGYTLRLPAGKTHIDGRQALALARTRRNECDKDNSESDLTRARRQQKIFSAMKRRLISPFAFVRLPLIAWEAPQAVRSDMSGPTLLGLFGAIAVAGEPETAVLGTQDGNVPEEAKQAAVARFLEG